LNSARHPGRAAWALVASLVVLGLAARLSPFLGPARRLFRQFPTEDGYLMLTIARNLAIGEGMSISAGEIPTNGTQPLATLLYAACFWVAGGDRGFGMALVLLLQVAIAGAAALVLAHLARQVLPHGATGSWLAALTGALWFAAPLGIRHTMNCLETGLYALCGLLAIGAVLRAAARPAPAWRAWATAGALLGLSFWARNDAVLLCAMVGIVHLLGWGSQNPGTRGGRFAELSVAALAALAVASPWLVHNVVRFGHLVPVSGQSESLHVSFAANLMRVPSKLFEYFLVVVPIPAVIEEATAFRLASVVAMVVVAILLAARVRPEPGPRRGLLAIGAFYTVALCLFYGLFFGAGHFMSRYLFPASPLLALLVVGAVAAQTRGRVPRPLVWVASAALLVMLAAYSVRLYARGEQHEHGQVIDWVAEHVAPEVWVGAVQTGTLGFFHDRTLNLDGKVSPIALEYRRRDEIPLYVVESEIDYLVDWAGIASWMGKPPLGEHFELLLEDQDRDLAVLRRKQPRSLAAARGRDS